MKYEENAHRRNLRVQKNLPVVGGLYRMASTSIDALDSTIVKIVSESGLVDLGVTPDDGVLSEPVMSFG